MQTLLPYLAILVVILTGWGIAKKLQVTTLLLFAGFALNLLAILAGVDNILPRGAKTTGWIGFDLFELLRALSRSQIASTGFIILVAGGFATYMDKIGATNKLVALCTKPLSRLSAPYVILGAVFLLGHFLGLVVTSAAGLGTLLAVSVFPLLLGVGVSAVAASAAIASALVFSYAPSSAIAVLAAKTAGAEPMTYLMQYQIPVAIPAVLTVLVLHILVQRYLDKKDMAEGKIEAFDMAEIEAKKTASADTPWFYALLPLVPLVLLFVFNKMVYKTIVLDVGTAMFIGWVFAILVDLATRRDLAKVFADGHAMFKGMGSMLTNVVGLIFVAALFADGLKNTGLVALLIEGAKSLGLGMSGTGLVVSAVIALVTLLTGSGVASFTGLVPIAPSVAAGLGGDPVDLAMMMQLASEMMRPVSPVAGIVIIMAGFAKTSPLAIVRRTWIPCTGGLIVSLATTILMM